MTPEQREFLHQTSIPIQGVNRALVLAATLLTGFLGGHKFLLGARREGCLYLLLCWTSLTVLASLGDFVDLVRQPVIGRGFLKRRLLKRHIADSDLIEPATWRQLGRGLVLFGVFAAMSAWMAYRMNEGYERVGRLCKLIQPGTSAQDLAGFAAANGLRLNCVREGFNHLGDTATLGRHSCNVTVVNARVTASEHHVLD